MLGGLSIVAGLRGLIRKGMHAWDNLLMTSGDSDRLGSLVEGDLSSVKGLDLS